MINHYPNDLICTLVQDTQVFKDPDPNKFVVESTENMKLDKGTLVRVIGYTDKQTYIVKPLTNEDIELHNVVHHQLRPDIWAVGSLLEKIVEDDWQQNMADDEKHIITFAAEMLQKLGELQPKCETLRKTSIQITNLFQSFYV